jgi:PAS domain S-box-containing protein
MNFKFSDLIEVAKVQRLNDLFYTATGIPAAVIAPGGAIVTCSGWQEICTKFHRVNEGTARQCVESDTVLANQIGVGQKHTVYKCGNGLVAAASPIIVGDEHVANFITSQFLFRPPDRDSFLEQAKRFGFDEAAYMEAVAKIPVIDESKLPPFLEYFSEFAALLGEMGLKQLNQLEATAGLRESEQRWASTLSSVGDAVIAADKDGRITFMNTAAEGLTGWTLTEAAAKPATEVFNIINERTRELVDNPVTKVLQEGMIVGLANDTVLLSRDGKEIPIDDSGAPIRDAAGHMVGVVLVFRDITERKAAEEALRESQRRKNIAQEIAHLGSWELDVMNNRLSWSDEVYRIFGLRPQEFGATYDAFLEAVHPEDREAVDAAYSGSLREGRDTYEIEHRVVRRSSGEIRIVHEKCEHFRDGTGRIVKSVGMVHDITERKRAEQELREARAELERNMAERTTELQRSEACLAEAQRLTNTGSWAFDLSSNKYVYASEECFRIFELDAQEGLPNREAVSRRIHPEDWDRVKADFEKLLREKVDTPSEFRVALPSGTVKNVQTIRHPVLNRAGDVVRIVGTTLDITERKRAEEALRLAGVYHRSLIESSLDPLVTIDKQGKISDVNAATEQVTGYPRSELIGTDFSDYFTESEKARAGYQKVFHQGFVRDYELEIWGRNGKITPVLYNASVYRDEAGNAIGVFAAARDIRERKRAEAEINNLKNYLSNIIDSMPSILVGMNNTRTVTQWNRRAEAFTGIPAGEAIGKPIIRLLPDFAPWIIAMGTGMDEHRPSSMENLLIEKEGERRFYDLMLYPLLIDDVGGAVLRVEDVTERARTRELMVQTEKMMSIGGLAAGMAHEINNPLGIIAQAAQNIERRISLELPANREVAEELGLNLEGLRAYFDKRQISDAITSIRTASSRAAKIVANMLQFSRRTATTMELTSLAQTVDQALELAASDYDLKKHYDFRSIDIIKDYQDIPQVRIVSVEIEQVILNLLKNAAQAMTANLPGRKPRLTLRLCREDRYVVLDVEDNGPGMTEDIRRRVFEPFFTTKEPGGGTGLGLSVSYMIVTQNHKGLMEVQSAPGSGTVFKVRLPIGESKT